MNDVARPPAADFAAPVIPVFRDKYCKGWPEHQQGEPAKYTPLATALKTRYRTDAHFAAYSVPNIHRRLATPEVFARLEDGVAMCLFVVDVDGPDHKCTNAWWGEQRPKINRLHADHPGYFLYRTRGGYRLIYTLATAQVLRSERDTDEWELRYQAWLAYLETTYGIVGDKGCDDWTRLFRLPHTTRDGRPQELESIGLPGAIGPWDVAVEIEIPAPPPPRTRTLYTPRGGEFSIRDLIGAEYPGAKFKSGSGAIADKVHIGGACCPWTPEHSAGSNNLTDTTILIMASGAFEFRCLHEHCRHRNHEDFRRFHQPDWKPYDPSRPPQRSSSEPIPSEEHPNAPHVNGVRHVSEIVHHDDAAEAAAVRDEQIGDLPTDDIPPPADDDVPKGTAGYDALGAARDYVGKHCMHADGPTLRRWRGEWYRWLHTLGCFRATSDEAIDSSLHQDFGMNRPANVRDVRAALIGVHGVLIDDVELGGWIGEPPADARDPLDVVATPRGLLHLPTRTSLDATPRFFATSVLGTSYDASAGTAERWLKFLHELWPEDEDSIQLLQEWAGYLLTPDTRQHKILMLIGRPRSGKGTIARVLTALLGAQSVVGPSLASLGANFGLAPFIGKTVAIIGDARLGARTDMDQVVERLLTLSGGDAITIDRKYLKAWTGYLSTRMMLISNELPKFKDASSAIATRMLALELTESFLGREDETLTAALLEELPAILNWAIEGWNRLRGRRHFVQPKSSKHLLDELSDLASPVMAWIRDRCDEGGEKHIGRGEAYRDYLGWALAEGHTHHLTSAMFGRDLRAAGCKPGQLGAGEERGTKIYRGLSRKPGLDDYPPPGARVSNRTDGPDPRFKD